MSYTPTLVISKEELDKNDVLIKEMKVEADKKNKRGTGKWYKRAQALCVLIEYLNRPGITFKDEVILIEQPDLSFLNQAVRDMLYELDIYYTEVN